MPRTVYTKKSGKRPKANNMSTLSFSYLASIAGYSGIGYSDITLPWEQGNSFKESYKYKKPVIYNIAMNELLKRNKCLICFRNLVPYNIKRDWNTRLLHRKCYLSHVDEILKVLGRK